MAFRICLIGCGGISGRMHGPSLQKYARLHSETELAACCDIDRARAESFASRFGFTKSYTDIFAMLAAEKPDAVSLVVPVTRTAGLACRILRMGFPLMLEKPPGLDRNETMSIIEAAREESTPNQVAFNRRHMPVMTELKRRLAEAADPGEPVFVDYHLSRIGRTESYFETTAIHGIDAVRFLIGQDYRSASFSYQEMSRCGEKVANFVINASFRSGALAQLSFCPVTGLSAETMMVVVRDHLFEVKLPVQSETPTDDNSGEIIRYTGGEKVFTLRGSDFGTGGHDYEVNGFYAEYETFLDAVRQGGRPEGDVASGLQAVEIMECIRNRSRVYEA